VYFLDACSSFAFALLDILKRKKSLSWHITRGFNVDLFCFVPRYILLIVVMLLFELMCGATLVRGRSFIRLALKLVEQLESGETETMEALAAEMNFTRNLHWMPASEFRA
jgi:hypothetical protein